MVTPSKLVNLSPEQNEQKGHQGGQAKPERSHGKPKNFEST